MTTLKRIALSFICTLFAFAVFAAILIVPAEAHSGVGGALSVVQTLPVYLFFTLLGWILALPFVIFFRRADGWRAWAMLAIGTVIGPCYLVTWMLLRGGRINWNGSYGVVEMPLFIGFLTTLFYVLLLKFFTTKTHVASSLSGM